MKAPAHFVFVDDGYPEAADYDNNYIQPAQSSGCASAPMGPWKRVKPPHHVAKTGILQALFGWFATAGINAGKCRPLSLSGARPLRD